MLWNASAINGYAIAASDGHIGTVSDFLFDDTSWRVRWLVVDTGNWLSGRKVLLPPSVLGQLDAKDQRFSGRNGLQGQQANLPGGAEAGHRLDQVDALGGFSVGAGAAGQRRGNGLHEIVGLASGSGRISTPQGPSHWPNSASIGRLV